MALIDSVGARLADPERQRQSERALRELYDRTSSRLFGLALRVTGLPVSDDLTVIFHGRRDMGTIQTYVARGAFGAGAQLGADALMRVPCDLDLGDAEDRDEAERMYTEQAAALRDALVGADTVLDVWREPLEDLAHAHVKIDTRIALEVQLPAHRLLPTALVAPDRQLFVAPVCGARARNSDSPAVCCW